MCGRFAFYSGDSLESEFGVQNIPANFQKSYNSAPGEDLPVIISRDGSRQVTLMRWGLVPLWAKDPAIGFRMINARSDTLAQKPSFRGPLKYHRCLIPADGFFEWSHQNHRKIPYYFFLKNKQPFAMAGLFDEWTSRDGSPLQSFTIITTDPNPLVHPIHDRMPSILEPGTEDLWLNPEIRESNIVLPLLKPFPEDQMDLYQVSPKLNSSRENSPDLLRPTP